MVDSDDNCNNRDGWQYDNCNNRDGWWLMMIIIVIIGKAEMINGGAKYCPNNNIS